MADTCRARTRERQYWAFAASPNVFDIESAVRVLELDLWPTRGKDIRVGDRAVIWKYKGPDPYRGVVALGEVIAGPALRSEDDRRFWVDASRLEALEERVLVRYLLPPGVPLWMTSNPNDPLRLLSVSRAAGGSVFYVTMAQWHDVLAAVGGWPEADHREP